MRGERDARAVADADEFYDRLKGAVYGAAIGDALGSAFAGLNSARIERELREPVARHYLYAFPGSHLYPRNPGIPSDHTGLALALADALLEPTPDSDLLARYFSGARANTVVSRAYPCAAYRDSERVTQVAGLQASLSSAHPSAIASAQAFAIIVHDALHTAALPLALPQAIRDDRMRAAWVRRHTVAHQSSPLPPHLRDVESNVWDTVASAHAIARLHARDPETAIGMAAASGNDTCAVASIAGAMIGAVNGFSALPRRWVEGLSLRDELERACEILYSVSRR